MNKIASKQRQTKVSQGAKREKRITKKACRCSPTPTSKKNVQPKTILRNQPKIKKVINNIRNLCGDPLLHNSTKELTKKQSEQSVIYIGTYPRQSYPVIDLTNSNTSLDDKTSYSNTVTTYQGRSYNINQTKTVYLPNFKATKINLIPRPYKSASLISLPMMKNRSLMYYNNRLPISSSSILLSENRARMLQRFSVLDLPPAYANLDVIKDFNSNPATDEYDHETMDIILDMEDDYQAFMNGKLIPERILDDSMKHMEIDQLINKYYV